MAELHYFDLRLKIFMTSSLDAPPRGEKESWFYFYVYIEILPIFQQNSEKHHLGVKYVAKYDSNWNCHREKR